MISMRDYIVMFFQKPKFVRSLALINLNYSVKDNFEPVHFPGVISRTSSYMLNLFPTSLLIINPWLMFLHNVSIQVCHPQLDKQAPETRGYEKGKVSNCRA